MAEPQNTPEHIVATAKIPVELDLEDFNRKREEVDAWINGLQRRMTDALDVGEAVDNLLRDLDRVAERLDAIHEKFGSLNAPAAQQGEREDGGPPQQAAPAGDDFGADPQDLKDIRNDVRDLKRQVDDVIDAIGGLQSIIGEKF
jgi:hypothetical protein